MDELLKNNFIKKEQVDSSYYGNMPIESVFIKVENFDQTEDDINEYQSAHSVSEKKFHIKMEQNNDAVETAVPVINISDKPTLAEHIIPEMDSKEKNCSLPSEEKHIMSVVRDVCSDQEHIQLNNDEHNYTQYDNNCKICGKPYGSNGHYHCNSPTHNRPISYSCDLCQKTFTEKRYLDSHMIVHTDERPYECETCGKKFKAKRFLNQHTKFQHVEKFNTPFSCDYCEKKFKKKSDCSRHIRSHTGFKPYICDLCNKAFSQPHTLRRHKLLHKREILFNCEICSKAFSDSSKFERHKKQHKLTSNTSVNS